MNLVSFKVIFILDRYDEHIQITFATRYEWQSNCIEFRFPKLMGTNVTLLKRETMAISRCQISYDEDGHDNDTFPHSTNTFFDLIYT